jgi:hypothetical protein
MLKPRMAAAIFSAAPYMARETVRQAVQDIADHGAGRGRDHADDGRQIRQRLLALLGEQPLGGQLPLAVLEQLEQRALARQLDRVDDQLVLGRFRIGGDTPGADDLHSFLELHAEATHGHAPGNRVHGGIGILEAEVKMARAVVVRPRYLAPHAHAVERPFEGALHRQGDFPDRIFRQVGGEHRDSHSMLKRWLKQRLMLGLSKQG